MILYNKGRVKIAELHFSEQEPPPPVDIVRYQSRPEPVRGTLCYEFHTVLVDLRLRPEEILNGMSKTTRQEIRRAERESSDFMIEFLLPADRAALVSFCDFYDEFAKVKGLPSCNRSRLSGMCDAGALALSRVRASDGSDIVWHCYVTSGSNTRLVHSCSLFRVADKAAQNQISRCNRYLHWTDMLRFREAGFETYDLGGWYSGKTDEEKLKINAFKESFGGQVTGQFNTDHALTWKGFAAIHLRRIAGALRGNT